jgi:uncharacterized protein
MLFLISPAKSLDYETPAGDVPHTQPLFTAQSKPLINNLRKKSWRQVAKLMDLSQNLAELNVARYAAWSDEFTLQNAKQAVLAFDGDVYDGLVAKTLSPKDLAWAQDHLCILSGLYGVLRPLDLMQPYRLEMGTTLKVGRANNLYQYWGNRISEHLNERLKGDTEPVVVNLASQEYFKAVNLKALNATVVECVFEDFKNGDYKVISFFAKRARGAMARFAVTQRVTTPKQLEGFAGDGYAFAPKESEPNRLVFRRKTAE